MSLLTRQSRLVDSSILTCPLTIIGAGGIGSFTTLTLAKMGFENITVLDDDTVEEHNIPNQFYRYQDLEEPKVEALKNIVEEFSNTTIDYEPIRFTKDTLIEFQGLWIMAVDNMDTRKNIYNLAYKHHNLITGIIDGRMGGQQAEVYTVNMQDRMERAAYNNTLWEEAETAQIPCTERAVIYNVLWIASTIANSARLLLEKKPYRPIQIMDFENQELFCPLER